MSDADNYLAQEPELALLADRLKLSPEQRDYLVGWHKPRHQGYSILGALQMMVADLRDCPPMEGQRRTIRIEDPEELMADSISRYPTLYFSRTDILVHMLLCVGCGYEWDKGVLITYEYPSEHPRIPIEAACIIAKRHARLRCPYPWSIYANLHNVPADVSPAWKAVCEEFRAHLTDVGYQFVYNEPKPQ